MPIDWRPGGETSEAATRPPAAKTTEPSADADAPPVPAAPAGAEPPPEPATPGNKPPRSQSQASPAPKQVVRAAYPGGNPPPIKGTVTREEALELCRQMIDLTRKTQEMADELVAQGDAQKRANDLLWFNLRSTRREIDKLTAGTPSDLDPDPATGPDPMPMP